MCQDQNHCHKCEKAKHLDVYFFISGLALTLFALYFDINSWKYVLWPWILVLVVYALIKLFGKPEKSKKK